MGDATIALVKNKFPYALENSEHHVLWTRTPISAAATTAWIQSKLPLQEFVWYKNPRPTMLSTVSEHYHVFVKK